MPIPQRSRSVRLAQAGGVLALLGVAVMSGCASQNNRTQAMKTAANETLAAHQELSQGNVDAAMRWLSRSQYTELDDVGLARRAVAGEVAIAMGDTERALEIVESAGAKAETHPHLLEVRGKAFLKAGRFKDAKDSLERARGLYGSGDDRARVSDLAVTAEGLDLYAQGRRSAAMELWQSIQEPGLRASLGVYAQPREQYDPGALGLTRSAEGGR